MLAIRRERDKSRNAEKLAESELAVNMNLVLFQINFVTPSTSS